MKFDIHIEPNAEDVLVRVRKDGMLQEYMHLPKASSNALSSRIKIMGNLNIAEKRLLLVTVASAISTKI
ncbi:MAG: ATPase, T2SS/T4P/T4SS family [Deinococcales bacterium]